MVLSALRAPLELQFLICYIPEIIIAADMRDTGHGCSFRSAEGTGLIILGTTNTSLEQLAAPTFSLARWPSDFKLI
jgi:hypothetical protein